MQKHEHVKLKQKLLNPAPRKTSPSYEPEGSARPLRAEEQRARLVGLLGTVQREKQEFNERVVALRTRKRELIKELSSIADQAGLPDSTIISNSGNSRYTFHR